MRITRHRHGKHYSQLEMADGQMVHKGHGTSGRTKTLDHVDCGIRLVDDLGYAEHWTVTWTSEEAIALHEYLGRVLHDSGLLPTPFNRD